MCVCADVFLLSHYSSYLFRSSTLFQTWPMHGHRGPSPLWPCIGNVRTNFFVFVVASAVAAGLAPAVASGLVPVVASGLVPAVASESCVTDGRVRKDMVPRERAVFCVSI